MVLGVARLAPASAMVVGEEVGAADRGGGGVERCAAEGSTLFSVVGWPAMPNQRSLVMGWSMMPSTGTPLCNSAISVPYTGFPALVALQTIIAVVVRSLHSRGGRIWEPAQMPV